MRLYSIYFMLVIFQIASVNTSLFFLLICVIWISSKVNKAQMKCILHKKWRQWVVEYSVQGLLNDYLKGLAFKINIVISNTLKALRYWISILRSWPFLMMSIYFTVFVIFLFALYSIIHPYP